MAACSGVLIKLGWSTLHFQSILTFTRSLEVSGMQLVQIHSSAAFCKRKPLRRKPIQVFLPEDGVQAHSHSPNVSTSSATTSSTTSGVLGSRGAGEINNIKLRGRASDTAFAKPASSGYQFESTGNKSKDVSRRTDHQVISEGVPTKQRPQNFSYNKAPTTDKRFGTVMALAKNRKLRERNDRVVLEGRRLIRDALLVGARCRSIFFSAVGNLDGLPIDEAETELVKVSYKEFQTWSGLSTPQGIVGIFAKPSYEMAHSDDSDRCLPMTLICDGIRDPGNLGTILRSAAAANCEKVLVTRGCVDIWDPKVLRAGAGAHFHTPISGRVSWSDVPNYLDADAALYIADSCHERTDGATEPEATPLGQTSHSDLDWTTPAALVVGGETEATSREAVDLCRKTNGTKVFIPMSKAVESLNAAMAASVMLFEAKRQWLSYRGQLKAS